MPGPVRELRSFFRASLLDRVERDDRAPETRSSRIRRRLVVTGTLIAGATVLGAALSIRPGDPLFYAATLGVAALWIAGAFASGRIRLGRARTRDGRTSRAVLQGFLLGALLLAVFLVGAIFVGTVPVLRDPVEKLLDHARFGSLAVVFAITALNGVAEELFFRGALYAALPSRWGVSVSVVAYAASTIFSGVPLLTFAAACVGLLTTLQRRVTGGVLGPIISHLTWSLGMLLLLPSALNLGRHL